MPSAFLKINKASTIEIISLLLREGSVGLDTRMCKKDLSLKTRVVTHPETSDTGRYVHSEYVS